MTSGPWSALRSTHPRFSKTRHVFVCCHCNKPFQKRSLLRFSGCAACQSSDFPVPVSTTLRVPHATKRLKLSHRSIVHTMHVVLRKPMKAVRLLDAYRAYTAVPGRTSLFSDGILYEGVITLAEYYSLTRREVTNLASSTQIQFKVSKELHSSFKALCAKQGVTMSELFILFMENMLANERMPPPEQDTPAAAQVSGR